MTLRREEAQTGNRYVRTLYLGVSVIACDHRGARGECRAGHLVGLGDGDSLTGEEIAGAEAEGWRIGDRDYCPAHAAEHSDGSDGEDAADDDE